MEEDGVVGEVVSVALFCCEVKGVGRPCELKGLLCDACRVQALYYRAYVIIYDGVIVCLRSSHRQQRAQVEIFGKDHVQAVDLDLELTLALGQLETLRNAIVLRQHIKRAHYEHCRVIHTSDQADYKCANSKATGVGVFQRALRNAKQVLLYLHSPF